MELIKNSSKKTVDNLFNSTTLIYKIPDYQRDYKWSEGEAFQFLEDFSDGGKISPQYFGVLVTENSKDKSSYENIDEIEIIDGQQRMTTIFLLFLAIREKASDFNIGNLVLNIDQKLISFDGINKMYRIKTHEYLKGFFDSISEKKDINTKNKKIKSVAAVYKIFSDYLETTYKTIEELQSFYTAIIKSEFVHIEIGNASPFEVFERMNYRGIDLAVSDLLKNKLFSEANKENNLELMKEQWDKLTSDSNEIGENIKKLQFSTLIRYFYISRFGYITEKKLYGKIVEKYKKHYDTNLDVFIKDFESVLNVLKILTKKRGELTQEDIKNLPGKNSERGYLRTILSLRAFGVIQPYSLLISLFSKQRDLDIRRWLNKIELFHFVYSYISNSPAREFEKKYADTAKNIFEATTSEDVQMYLNKLTEDFSDLIYKVTNKEKFIEDVSSDLKYGSDSDVIRFYYEYLEEDFCGRNLQGDTFINDQQISLDHIIPQSIVQNHNIGNIIPLEKDLNNRIKDENFMKKKEMVLVESGINITKYFFKKYQNGDDEDVSNWSKEAAELFWVNIIEKNFKKKNK